MTTQNAPGRAALITAVVIIVVALLAAGVSSVVGTAWVLLTAVPLLATLRLVLNLLDGAQPNNPARVGRIMALAIIGVTLLAAGISTVMTLWTSSSPALWPSRISGSKERPQAPSRRSHPSTAAY